jgi:hypothetical protein
MVEPALLARIEGTEWWRREGARSDFVAAWIAVSPATTEKLGALAWVEVHGQAKNTFLRGWID